MNLADWFGIIGIAVLVTGLASHAFKQQIRQAESCMVINEKSPPN